MTRTRRPARLTAWIAIAAVLLAALAPGLARALPSSAQAMPWNEICSVAGTQNPRDALSNPRNGQHHDETFKHCPFCLNHAGHCALPATPPALVPATDAGTTLPCVVVTPSAPRCACASPPSRAPPVLS